MWETYLQRNITALYSWTWPWANGNDSEDADYWGQGEHLGSGHGELYRMNTLKPQPGNVIPDAASRIPTAIDIHRFNCEVYCQISRASMNRGSLLAHLKQRNP